MNILVKTGRQPVFRYSPGRAKRPETQLHGGLFSAHPDCNDNRSKENRPDHYSSAAVANRPLQKNLDFVPRITEQYKRGAEVASFCVGAFLACLYRVTGWLQVHHSLDGRR